jgi:5'-methylthioadenosine phosphorylase
MVTNYAAGISDTPLTHDEVVERMSQNVHKIRDLFFAAISSIRNNRDCNCTDAAGAQTPLTGIGQK